MAELGFVLYEGPSLIDRSPIVAILTLHSTNEKTGDMCQVWILPQEQTPLAAVQTNDNRGVCGDCPLQGIGNGAGEKIDLRACYVNLGQAPNGIYRAWRAGRYLAYSPRRHNELLKGRTIRLGAYGDPAALPLPLIRQLCRLSSGWTGYSHQMLSPTTGRWRADKLAQFVMCSCHNLAQYAEAKRRGYRAFLAVPEGHREQAPADAVECPFYTHGVQCADCQLCQGTSRQARSIWVEAHSASGRNLLAIVQQGK